MTAFAILRVVEDTAPVIRLATADDIPVIDALMKASTRAIFPAFYDERQTASSVIHIAHVDPMLVDDGTYFVVDAGRSHGRDIVACAGCHEAGPATNCIRCHKVGGYGGNPHPRGWKSARGVDSEMCRYCHE